MLNLHNSLIMHRLKVSDLDEARLDEYRKKLFYRQHERNFLQIEQLLPSFIRPEKSYEKEIDTLIKDLNIKDFETFGIPMPKKNRS